MWNKTRIPTFITFIQYVLEVWKQKQLGRRKKYKTFKLKISIFADDMMSYIEKSKYSP